MNPDVKTKWVAALRSGDYTQQTDGILINENGFCCLGVLCEISKAETGFGIRENIIECDGEYLSNTIQDWAGLPFMTGDKVNINGIFQSLAAHNDSAVSFLALADAIEVQL